MVKTAKAASMSSTSDVRSEVQPPGTCDRQSPSNCPRKFDAIRYLSLLAGEICGEQGRPRLQILFLNIIISVLREIIRRIHISY